MGGMAMLVAAEAILQEQMCGIAQARQAQALTAVCRAQGRSMAAVPAQLAHVLRSVNMIIHDMCQNCTFIAPMALPCQL